MAFACLFLTIFVMFLQPTSLFPNLENFQPLRNSAILALVLFVLWGKKAKHSFFSSSVNASLCAFAVLQVISSSQLWLVAGWEMFNYWLKIGIVYFLIVKSVVSFKKLIAVILAIVFGIVYLSYYSISKFILFYQAGVRAGGYGWYEGANDIAIILVSVIPLVFCLSHFCKHKLLKYALLCLVAFFTFNLLFTGSRNGLLGLGCVGILSLLLLKSLPGFLRSVLLILLFVAIVTTGIHNVMGRGDIGTGLVGDSSSEDRLVQWSAGVRMLFAKPLFGVGPEQFASAVGEFGGVPNLAAHNTFIQIFAENGVLAGISFCLFIFMPLLFNIKLLKRKQVNSDKEWAVESYQYVSIALIGFLVCALFSNRNQFYILFVLVGLLVAIKENMLFFNESSIKA